MKFTGKKIIVIALSGALLLTGCAKSNAVKNSAEMTVPTVPATENEIVKKDIIAIEMYESGGEDGRINHWQVRAEDDGSKRLIYDDMHMKERTIFELTEEEYREFTEIDFSPYIGKKDDNEGVCDAVYYEVKLTYEDGTSDTSEASIPDLWQKLGHYLYETDGVKDDTIAGEPFSGDDSRIAMKEPTPEDIVTDEETGIKYVKNQLLVSVFPDTERAVMEELADAVGAEIVGEIALTGDYQIEFREDKDSGELQKCADILAGHPSVLDVTLNLVWDEMTD